MTAKRRGNPNARPSEKARAGFLLGNQAIFARARGARPKEINKHGSWWVGVSREEWGAKCAEVFPDLVNSKEGQKPFRPWKDARSI